MISPWAGWADWATASTRTESVLHAASSTMQLRLRDPRADETRKRANQPTRLAWPGKPPSFGKRPRTQPGNRAGHLAQWHLAATSAGTWTLPREALALGHFIDFVPFHRVRVDMQNKTMSAWQLNWCALFPSCLQYIRVVPRAMLLDVSGEGARGCGEGNG